MAWACKAASGKDSLIFIDDVIHDGRSRINSEVYKNIVSANLHGNTSCLIGSNFNMKQNNTPKQTGNSTKGKKGRF